MESMKDNTLAFSKFFQDSEASHQSVVAQLNSKLSKVRKEYGNLELSRGNLELSLSASRNRAQRRFAFQKNFLEINARNLERAVIRKGHSSAQTVIDGILSSNSLPADQGDEKIQQEGEKSTNDAGIEIENPYPGSKV
ncbi:hypothetical protein C5167_021597 [Papaver somniferum]|nr:hypothetical protein C5167_021597 [Papaver somniferum]